VPHLAVVPVLVSLDGVDAESTTKSLEEELECRSHDVARRGCKNVEFLAKPQYWKGDNEHDGGNEVCEPKADVALSVNHRDLSNQCTNVDEEVEVVVDTGDGRGGVDNDALALHHLDAHLFLGNLLGNEGRNVGLECTSTCAHDEDTENKNAESSIGLVENRGSRRGDENQVTDLSKNDGIDNRLVATEIGVGDPGTKQGADVDPESIESGQRKGNLLAHVERTRNGFGIVGVEGSTSGSWARLGNEIAVDGHGSIVGHALNKLDKGNGVDAPWNRSGHTAKSLELLVGGEVSGRVAVADVGILKTSLALAELVGGRTSLVELRVVALRVTRAVNERRVKARYTLSKLAYEARVK
jgi:hypothetical protein